MRMNAQAKNENFPETVSEEVKINALNILKNTPLTFIKNSGQMDSIVKYYAKAHGCTIYFTPNEVKFSLVSKASPRRADDGKELPEKEEFSQVTVAQEFIGANNDVKIQAQDKCSATVNYFKGNDPAKWRTQIPTYQRIIYKELWDGIDLAFYGESGKLKYEFTIQPGASVEDIRFQYKDSYETMIDDAGNLVIKTPLGDMTDEKPLCYQQISGNKVVVKGDYTLLEKNMAVYGYKMDNYDNRYPLIIDPGIIYSSYLGGIEWDNGNGIAVDQSGNAYVTGFTRSADFPIVNAFQPSIAGFLDAFVIMIDSTSSIVYSSYLGGSVDDRGYGIAVDQSGNVYVTGNTSSTDFPTVNAFQSSYGGSGDAFITKIDSTPSIVYSSYLGGSSDDSSKGVTVDQNGNAYVTGYTRSSDFPAVNAFQSNLAGGYDVFITKIDSTPLIVYSSYLGGSDNDLSYGIAVDQEGSAYLTGYTVSSDYPTVNAFQSGLAGWEDAIITKINSTPSIVYSSYLGGNYDERGQGIAVAQNGNAYVTGYTYSTNFPTVNAFQSSYGGSCDAFITMIDPSPSIVYSSYLGGSNTDNGYGIAVDQNGNAYVTGDTRSSDFPIANAFQSSLAGDSDVFITKIDSTPTIVYSSYLGGSAYDVGKGTAVDQNGNVYITGYTRSTNFPTVNAFQSSFAGWDDAFITKIGGPLSLQIAAANLSIVVFD